MGIDASKRIAEALENQPELQVCQFEDILLFSSFSTKIPLDAYEILLIFLFPKFRKYISFKFAGFHI